MVVKTLKIQITTLGNSDILDITEAIASSLRQTDLQDGIVTVFCPSATSGLTTIEYELGCLKDLQRLFDEIVDPDQPFAHNQRWGDGNGHSHVRAALLGPSITIPFCNRTMTLGTWQQVIFIDFDNRPRERNLVVQVIGE